MSRRDDKARVGARACEQVRETDDVERCDEVRGARWSSARRGNINIRHSMTPNQGGMFSLRVVRLSTSTLVLATAHSCVVGSHASSASASSAPTSSAPAS